MFHLQTGFGLQIAGLLLTALSLPVFFWSSLKPELKKHQQRGYIFVERGNVLLLLRTYFNLL